MSSKDNDEKCGVHSKSSNIEFMIIVSWCMIKQTKLLKYVIKVTSQ